jgi:hypothetical protein
MLGRGNRTFVETIKLSILPVAHVKILESQRPLLDRLVTLVATSAL